MGGREELLKGIRRNIGNGRSTRINDAWIPGNADWRAGSVAHENWWVSDLIVYPQRIWDMEKLRSLFSEDVVRSICSIPIGPEEFKDRWIWCYDPKGKFSVKSCYNMIKGHGRQQGGVGGVGDCKFWKWLWKLTIPPKLKFFIWRICHNAIATKANLGRRNCAPNEVCPCCNNHPETSDHLLFRCQAAQDFWRRVCPNLQLPNDESNFRGWFAGLKETTNEEESTKICYMLWLIWKRRNRMVFDNTATPVEEMMRLLHLDISTWNHCRDSVIRNEARSPARNPPVTTLTPMIYPRKIMCDGAFKADIQIGAYGIIMFDAEGRVVDGRARRFVCRASICAEAMGVSNAVSLACGDRIPTLIITDCQVITKALNQEEDLWPWEAASIIATIKTKMERNTHITLQFAGREELKQVDRIAKLARDGSLPTDWLGNL